MTLSRQSKIWFPVIIVLGMIVGLGWLNYKLQREIKKIDPPKEWESQHVVAPPQRIEPASTDKNQKQGEMIRKMRLDPSRKFSESIIFRNGQEVARFKLDKRKMDDFTGHVPDGEVKFIDESQKTFGTEFYQDDKLHGPYVEYYEGGALKRESQYRQGELIYNKEYFFDGKLRMEENFEDALYVVQGDEVGDGKIYFRDGTLMYEWHLTNSDPNRYKRSYNKLGELVADDKYNETGELVRKWRKPRAAPFAHEDANVPK
jgi:antitoxin component YwqK of YwqJK toxin-antitoxin module